VLTRPEPLPRLLDRVREAFGMGTVAILERRDGQWVVSACSGPPDCGRPEQADVDVAVEPDVHLVAQGRPLPAADRRLLEAVAGQALIALRNRQIADEAAEARRRADAVELRSALLSAVGHDLRTPLTSIRAAAGSLRDGDIRLSPEDRSELAATIEESADRLTGLVNNLLDSSRLATGAVTPDLRPVGYDEVAVLAVRGLDGAGRVQVEIDEHLPEVLADPGSWNVSSRTSSTTRCATGGERPSSCGPVPTPTSSSCASSTPGRGCPSRTPRSSSSRSSASATAPTTASGSA
jgi:two-component system sensor histidine kinase KdpD